MFVKMFVKRNSAFSILILTLVSLVLTDGKGIRDSIVLPPLPPGPVSIRPRVYRTFFMLNSVEGENLNAHKYKNIKECVLFSAQ